MVCQDKLKRSTVLLFAILLSQLGISQTVLYENFERSGGDWSNTIFTHFWIPGGDTGVFETSSLSNISNAPTGTNLPISKSDADLEGRYFESRGKITGTISYAFLSESYATNNQAIEGYVSLIGGVAPAAGFCLRTDFDKNGYTASITSQGVPNQFVFHISKQLSGIIRPEYNLYVSSITVDCTKENLFLKFDATGDLLTAELWKVSADGTLTYLDGASINDSTFAIGVPAITAFARGDTSIIFDDITVIVPEPTTLFFILGGMLLLRKSIAFSRVGYPS